MCVCVCNSRRGALTNLTGSAPHPLRTLCHERPYREHNTPDNTALGFTGTHKPRHLNKVTVHGEASLLLNVVSSSGLLP